MKNQPSTVKNIALIIFWLVLIFSINELGRYLYIVFFEGGYKWYKVFYIVIAGSIATLNSAILFFLINYFLSKKNKEQNQFSFTLKRLFILVLSTSIAFVGERIYLFISDYLLYNHS